jgi:GT2 family glycosyltransferase
LELSVIIVNYRVPVFLEQCIISVKKAMQQLSGEIIVVDNASADNSMERLSFLFPDVHFIPSAENAGFAKANNLGLSYAKGRYVLFLNPDTLVPENTLAHCVSFLEQHHHCGAVGVRMINGFGKYLPESKRAKPTLANSIFKLTGAATLFPQSALFNRYALGHLSVYEQHPVDVLAGAFMMVRKNILDQLQGFDTDFFMYGEDVDLSVRIRQLGHHIFYLGDALIIHYKGQSSRNRTQKQNRIFYKAMRLFVHKHYKAGWLLIPFIFMTQWMAAFRKWLFPPRSVLPMLNRPGTAFIVGNAAAYNQVMAILAKRAQTAIVKGCISVHETNDLQVGRLTDLSLRCQQHLIKQLLICVPDLSLQEATQLMLRQKGLFFRFVFSGSESLPFNN